MRLVWRAQEARYLTIRKRTCPVRGSIALSQSSFLLGFLTVDLLHLACGSSFQLLALALCRRDSVLDRLAHRVIGIGHHVARFLCRILRPLHGLAARQLYRFASDAVDLTAPRARGDVSAGHEANETAKDEPAETSAAAVISFGHS